MANDMSAYEAKRLHRMQQNQQMLQSLGIQIQPKVRKPRVLVRDELAEPVEPRRSSRLRQLSADSLEPEPPLDLESALPRPKRARVPDYKPVKLPRVDEELQRRGKRSRQSSTLLDLDLNAFHDRWLGKQIWPKGKKTVMEGMCPEHLPMFGKMSGIQRWRNGVVLFVNVLGVSGYTNSFTESAPVASDGKSSAVFFRWFAQDRQHEESPVIVRLLAAQRGDPAFWLEKAPSPTPMQNAEPTDTASSIPVLLFLRHIDGPYIYCGRLGYLGHLPDSSPIEFRWQLLDVDKLDWTHVKELIDASNQHADDAVVEGA